MTTLATDAPALSHPPAGLFVATVFASAALVFLVEPMIAKLVLPMLGGGPSVWNTSLAFFQVALLAGYGYAHALQRVKSLKAQAAVHGLALLAAAVALPLRINDAVGAPSSTHPTLWLLGVLAVSIGAPFAVLSATAPLVQAWHARTLGARDGREPYALYAASNLGSLLALLAYPLAVEPGLTLHTQRLAWSGGYLAFIFLMSGLAVTLIRAHAGDGAARAADRGPAPSWRERLTWVWLAAVPSSLMLGVTSYLTTDVASAPFLWVLPLALYLATFIIAFQTKPAIPSDVTLVLQGFAVAACATILPFAVNSFVLQLPVHLAAFFLTALMCHQALVARRPAPGRLTEFYFWMSLGGVVGGSFNAFLAPVIFDNVWEYPLVLALSCLVRPWNAEAKIDRMTWALLILGVLAGVMSPIVNTFVAPHVFARPLIGGMTQVDLFETLVKVFLGAAAISAFLLRGRGLLFFCVVAVLSIGANAAADKTNTTQSWRSFFGVLKQSQTVVPALGGPVRMLAHGTTMHGAEATTPPWTCNPLVYYARSGPIGQVFLAKAAATPALDIGAVGLGTGSVAAYVRPSDRLTFFEIDPLVIRISTDPAHFAYTTRCAQGPVGYVLGDARLTLAKQAPGRFDILLIDAFSSDAVPTHLLTTEAVRGYLTKLKPDGVLILHLSNRNLELNGPAQAVARAAGGVALIQHYRPLPGQDLAGWPSPEDAVIVARSSAGLSRFAQDHRWQPTDPTLVRPWTDDYVNLVGALYRRLKQKLDPDSEG
ncbi:MAG: spermidine synthase [Phenylobacterium sp.]